MDAVSASTWVRGRATALGIDLCGIAPAEAFPELARLEEWLGHGYAGQMRYLRDPRRGSPARLMEDAHSVIVCALNYHTPQPHSGEMASGASTDAAPRGWISRYAWGDDYHRVLGEKLEKLIAGMREEFPPPFEARAYVDTGPIVERVAAKHAGLGWLGKNTCLIHPELGSWLFLGVIVTTLEFAPSLGPGEPPQPDLCGQCTLCLEACPTGALVEPYVLDARRCISYLTIEHRGSLPEDLRPAMGGYVFGCDICQDVCPWNRKAPVTMIAEFAPRRESTWSLLAPELEWLAGLTEAEYHRVFRGSAVKRAKYQGIVRNACVALGNAAPRLAPAARERARTLLVRLSASPDVGIAEHAAWALAQLEKFR
jgi:epoxyqueuosine reductase